MPDAAKRNIIGAKEAGVLLFQRVHCFFVFIDRGASLGEAG